MARLQRLYNTIPNALDDASTPLESVTFRVAETVHDLKAATRLVYREYVRRGYVKPNPSELKLSLFHALPETTTFIAEHREYGVVGTVALIEDSPLGLPMDEAYQPELNALRRDNQHLAEISMLTFAQAVRRPGAGLAAFRATQLLMAMHLFKVMFDYLRKCTAVSELVACFNPRHDILYEFLGLRRLGGLRPYSVVNGKPSTARRLNVVETERLAEREPVIRFFYQAPRPADVFASRLQLTADHLGELFVRSSSVFASASPSELAYLQQRYGCPLLEDTDLTTPSPATPSFESLSLPQ